MRDEDYILAEGDEFELDNKTWKINKIKKFSVMIEVDGQVLEFRKFLDQHGLVLSPRPSKEAMAETARRVPAGRRDLPVVRPPHRPGRTADCAGKGCTQPCAVSFAHLRGGLYRHFSRRAGYSDRLSDRLWRAGPRSAPALEFALYLGISGACSDLLSLCCRDLSFRHRINSSEPESRSAVPGIVGR